MPRKVVETANAPKPDAAYSQAITAGDFVFAAGQDGHDPATGKRLAGIEAQTRQALSNIRAVLNAAGTNLENVVKVSVLLSDLNDFDSMNRVYSEFFPAHQPARTILHTTFEKGMLIEIDAIALLPTR